MMRAKFFLMLALALALVLSGVGLPNARAADDGDGDNDDVTVSIPTAVIWPPNNKMVDETVTASVPTQSGDQVSFTLYVYGNDGSGVVDAAYAVTSQPAVATGDTTTASFPGSVRAKRTGQAKNGRIYVFRVEAAVTHTNSDGSMSTTQHHGFSSAVVPHDQSRQHKDAATAAAAAAQLQIEDYADKQNAGDSTAQLPAGFSKIAGP